MSWVAWIVGLFARTRTISAQSFASAERATLRAEALCVRVAREKKDD